MLICNAVWRMLNVGWAPGPTPSSGVAQLPLLGQEPNLRSG